MEQTKDRKSNDYKNTAATPTGESTEDDTVRTSLDVIADLEATLNEVAEANPRIDDADDESSKSQADLRALLEVSLTINSSLVLDDVLQIVMRKAIELMQAERGLIMLLDDKIRI